MRYIALKRMRVGDGYREPGEEVPEAALWRSKDIYVATGKLAIVPDDSRQPAKPHDRQVTYRRGNDSDESEDDMSTQDKHPVGVSHVGPDTVVTATPIGEGMSPGEGGAVAGDGAHPDIGDQTQMHDQGDEKARIARAVRDTKANKKVGQVLPRSQADQVGDIDPSERD